MISARDLVFISCQGVDLPVSADFVSPKIEEAIRLERYEHAELHALRNIIEQGDVIMEVGAGIGFLSTYCAKDSRVKSVTAYEANPVMHEVIKTTFERNRVNVEFIGAAVGRSYQNLPFYIADEFWASSFFPTKNAKLIDLPVIPFCEELKRTDPTVLVMDIEGAELEALQGCDLSGVRNVILELHPSKYRQIGVKRILDLLSSAYLSYDCRFSNRNVVLFTKC